MSHEEDMIVEVTLSVILNDAPPITLVRTRQSGVMLITKALNNYLSLTQVPCSLLETWELLLFKLVSSLVKVMLP